MMKSQDILLLLKLVALERQRADLAAYSMRALQEQTGISKSEVSSALKRCIDAGLARLDQTTGMPHVNTRALSNFLQHGLKYVFPARPRAVTRGIATAHAAPVFAGKLLTGGDSVYVWPDAKGKEKGQAVEPLFKTVPDAARRDEDLYAMLALLDSIRLGNEREASLAKELLQKYVRDNE
jgi:hypothetical protein